MAYRVLLNSVLVILGIASTAGAVEPLAPSPYVVPSTLTFSSGVSNVMDVKTLRGTTTIEGTEIQRLGDRNFLVGKLVTHSTLTKEQVPGSRIWVPISDVLEIIEHEKGERPRPAAASDKFVPDSRVEVEWGGKWWPAEILERKESKYRIHYTGWSDSWDEWVTIERMRLVAVPLKNVEVEWGGTWWPATVLASKDGKFHIHYTDHSDTWDEWVASDRIRNVTELPANSKEVEVEWGNTWWAAEILDRKDGKYRIHYTGYGEQSDEWVTRDRIRAKAAQDNVAKPE